MRSAVQPLVYLLHHRAVVAQPDRAREHQNVGSQHLVEYRGPVVGSPSVFAHVRPYAGGDVVVDSAHNVHLDAVLGHDADTDVDEALRVADLGRSLQCAVEEERLESAEVAIESCHHSSFRPRWKKSTMREVSVSTSCPGSSE